MSAVRGVRGAITVERDDATLLLDATERLLREIIAENGIRSDDVASALFTLTPDLVSQFPALAARRIALITTRPSRARLAASHTLPMPPLARCARGW